MENLNTYWNSIPIGYENRKTYAELCDEWGMNKRGVRLVLHRLAASDNGDGMILIRSAYSTGFYRTDDPAEIERYRREVISRASNTFSMLRKINRIMGEDNSQLKIELN